MLLTPPTTVRVTVWAILYYSGSHVYCWPSFVIWLEIEMNYLQRRVQSIVFRLGLLCCFDTRNGGISRSVYKMCNMQLRFMKRLVPTQLVDVKITWQINAATAVRRTEGSQAQRTKLGETYTRAGLSHVLHREIVQLKSNRCNTPILLCAFDSTPCLCMNLDNLCHILCGISLSLFLFRPCED